MLTLQQCCNNYTFFIFMSCKTCHSTATRLIPRTKCNLWNIWRHLLGLLFSPWVTRTVVSATIWSLVVSHVRLYSFGLLRCFFPFFFYSCAIEEILHYVAVSDISSWPKKWWWRSQVPSWSGGSLSDSITRSWTRPRTTCTGANNNTIQLYCQ